MMHLPDQNDRSPVIGVRSRFIYLYSFTLGLGLIFTRDTLLLMAWLKSYFLFAHPKRVSTNVLKNVLPVMTETA